MKRTLTVLLIIVSVIGLTACTFFKKKPNPLDVLMECASLSLSETIYDKVENRETLLEAIGEEDPANDLLALILDNFEESFNNRLDWWLEEYGH